MRSDRCGSRVRRIAGMRVLGPSHWVRAPRSTAGCGDYAAFSRTVSGTGSGLLALPSIDSTVMKIMSWSPRFSRSCTLNSPAPYVLVARLARIVGVLDRGAVHQVLAPAPAVHRGPEIVQHVAMEADALAGLQPDRPHAQLLGLGQKLGTDAAVRLLGLARELGFQRGRPLGLHVAVAKPSPSWTSPWHSSVEYGQAIASFVRCGRNAFGGDVRALVIGGSMSGLLAALALKRRGWRCRGVRARRRAARRARRRHRGAAGTEGGSAHARARCRPRSRHRGAVAADVRARRPRDPPLPDRADHDGVGPRVSLAESRAPGGRLSPRQGIAPRRAGRAACRRISPTARRRRATSWSARTASARPCASNFCPRSRRSMRATRRGAGWWPKPRFRPRCTATCSSISRSACPTNEQMLGYPVAGPDNDLRPGHRRYNFVWYRPASEARELPRLLTDDTGRTHALSIPPPLIARDVDRARCARRRRACSRRSSTRWSRCASSRSCSRSTISKCRAWRSAASRSLGDAAFVARPHVGAGVAKAADDALALADALAANADVESCAEDIRSRASCRSARKIIARARHLGAYVQADLKTRGRARIRRAPPHAGGGAGRNRDDGFLSGMFPFDDATRQLDCEPCAAFTRLAGDTRARAQARGGRDHARRRR